MKIDIPPSGADSPPNDPASLPKTISQHHEKVSLNATRHSGRAQPYGIRKNHLLIVNGGFSDQRLKSVLQEATATSKCEDFKNLRTTGPYSAPIFHLPNEILTEIFRIATEDRRKLTILDIHDDTEERWEAFEFLVTLTHVCRGWRQVALQFSELWTHASLPAQHGRYLHFQELSQDKPLSLVVQFPWTGYVSDSDRAKNNSSTYRAIAAVSSRLRRLDIDLPSMGHAVPSWLLDIRVPCLKSLTILYDEREDDSFMGPHVERKVLFADQVSPLEGLALINMRGWLPANNFPNLTHLFLALPYIDPVTPSVLISLLQNTPRLQHLHLNNLQYYGRETVDEPLPLESLKSFVISESYLNTAEVIHSFRLPEHTCLRMPRSKLWHSHVFQLNGLSAVRGATDLDIRVAPPLDWIHLALQTDRSGFWVEGMHTFGSDLDVHPWIHSLFSQLHIQMPLADVTTFTLDVPYLDPKMFVPVLSHLPRLATLKLRLSA
ncbi:uncharacterized protein BXZ73DRAFT_52950, partial [Epithele typhae]|uniref:uncharacterized protein n=1 Tax=Epithele typhae TaxID=378194 RepID=UPI0020072624